MWDIANDAIIVEGKRVLIGDPARFDGVTVLGVDEHCWRHTRGGDKFVTVIIDLIPVAQGTGPARLLDMVEGRSKQVFKRWLFARPAARAMDGFTGFKTAAEELPGPAAVVDPFHVVRLAGEAVDRCRQRVQQDTCGHRGRRGDPLYRARRTLFTGADLLTDKQATRLEDLFADDDHVEVEATWGIYQCFVQAYRCTDPGLGSHLMASVIEVIATGVPAQLTELVRLGRTLKRRATDILAFFDHSGTSNGPHRSTQRPPRTPPRLRSRVPEPDPLHRPLHPRSWWFQTPTTPSNRMSPQRP